MAKLYLVLPLLGILIAASGTDAAGRTLRSAAGKSTGRRTRSLLQDYDSTSPPPDYEESPSPPIEYVSPGPGNAFNQSPDPISTQRPTTTPTTTQGPTQVALSPPRVAVPILPANTAIKPPSSVTGTGTAKAPPAAARGPSPSSTSKSGSGGLSTGAIAGIVVGVVAGVGGKKNHHIIFLLSLF